MFEPWAIAPVLPHRYSLHDVVCVTRRVDAPIDHVARRLADLSGPDPTVAVGERAALQLPARPERAHRGLVWRAPARLHTGGLHLLPYVRVQIEVSAWSDGVSELFVRPTSHHAVHWGRRHLRRYVELAPLAADALADRLAADMRRPQPTPHVVAVTPPAAA